MKLKLAVLLAPALALGVLAVSAEAQQHKATRLGNPATRFAKKVPKKSDDVRVLLRGDKTKADAVAVLNEVGWKGDLEDFDRAAAAAEISEVKITPGTRMPFMASRKNRKAHALLDVLWNGKKPFDAFTFEFSSKCVRYRVVTPKACGNFWIEDLGKDPSEACNPKPKLPPVVGVTSPGEVCVTQPVEINVSVQNPPDDGRVAVSVNGKELAAGSLSGGSYKATFPGSAQPGSYEVTATSGGVSGRTSFTVKACPPTCAITVSPAEAHAGKPISVDVTGSRVAAGVRGGIKSAKVEVLDAKGVVTGSYELPASGLTKNDVVIKKSGVHSVRAVVTDEAGQASTNECQASLDLKGGVPLFLGAYFGKERLVHDSGPGSPGGRCAPLVGAEIGFQPKLGDNTELEIALGGKINTRDSDNSSIFGDLAVNHLLGSGFFGGGISAWDLTRSNGSRTVALLLQGGVDLSKDGKWQFVAQARAPFNKFDDLDNNYQFWGGFRFRPFSWK